MKRILQYCGLTSILNDQEAIELPENDSQKNSGLSKEALSSYRAQLTEAEISRIDVILRQCGFPACEQFPLEASGLEKELAL